uniref:2-iminobutanoate/2-iminopropanoate deaminase n=1 Tax=Ornithorhynchus anatinus TaxID=9258 RepID=A0A6I8NZ27_ORNAN
MPCEPAALRMLRPRAWEPWIKSPCREGAHCSCSLLKVLPTMTSLSKKVLSTDKAPRAIGPYSQGILIDRTLYISGQVGRDPSSGKLVSGGLVEEVKQALTNVGEILKTAGCDFSNVFKGSFPARSAYQVAALPLVGAAPEPSREDGGRQEDENQRSSTTLCWPRPGSIITVATISNWAQRAENTTEFAL